MASSSTSPSHDDVYNVFINHRGPDVKNGLASHIYRRLIDHGLKVFLDKPEMQEGEPITPQIKRAIRTASVHIAIFSKGYADSTWCLDELLDMLDTVKSGSAILPVFYNVQPSDLRWTRGGDTVYARVLSIFLCILLCTRGENGVYARALRKLQKKTTLDSVTNKKKPRHDSDTIEKWRKALSDVSLISGFELNACNGDERQLVDKVVQRVLEKVPKVHPPLNVAKYPSGLDEKIQDVDRILSLQQQRKKARVVGIVGLGGIGKTTLAKKIYNREKSNYKRICLLRDVRSSNLHSLQSRLLKELNQSSAQINDIDEGIEKLKTYSERALIVLDDVDDISQLDALFASLKDTIHVDSLILVTSRNKDVLTSSGITESSIYRLKGLNRKHSQELFCFHAFGQPHPVVGFEEVVEKFLDVCDGLPLSLKVLGALLHGKDLWYWKEQLGKTSTILPRKVRSTLEISFDALDKQEKEVFLDIACFFIGENRDTIRIWDGWLNLENLKNRCLVEVDSENCLRMHDHLRDLGRDLAENSEYPRRIWRMTDSLLHNVSDQSPVRGISMVHRNGSERSCNLSNCKLLKAESHFVEQVLSNGQLLPLIYLRWENYPKSSLPPSLPSMNLRVLHIQGKQLKTLWQHESQAPLQLRELYVNAPLSKVPESIGTLKYLEKIVLYNGSMTLLPDSVGHLTGLQTLDLIGCSTLQMLPDSVGNLTGLQKLDLSWCSTLQMLPDSVGNLTGLQTLALGWCSTLQTLPDSVGNLTGLQTLDLIECSTLQTLPDSVGNLTGLQTLYLSRCSTLQTLPDSVGNLTGLQTLYLSGCSTLQTLPDSVGNLTGLQTLYLSGCSTLQTLPDSVGNLTGLQTLNLDRCSTLQTLPDLVGNLKSLQTLDLDGCSTLQTLPDSVGNLTGLQTLNLSGCSTLQTLPDSFGNLTGLQTLNLIGCSTLQTLPDSFGNLTGLQTLNLIGCSTLQTLPDSVGNLTGLQILYLGGCFTLQTLQTLPDLVGTLTGLQTLYLDGYSTLQMLPDSIWNLMGLKRLTLAGATLCRRSQVGNLTGLQTLHLTGLQTLKDRAVSLTFKSM
uniref:TIR domain-containing protein n=1 Tax=Picea sitchensis TaxID=3332 RepID=C0PQE2_PICSI|nr:unknown [Picea sitchensis]